MTTYLITGSNRGIGAELVRQARNAGHRVIASTRDDMDVADGASVTRFAQKMSGETIDVLVCNAGVYLDKGLALKNYTPDLWAKALAVNVTGVFSTIQAFLPNLRAGSGKIAVISSQMGSDTRAGGGSYAYRASKAAVTNLVSNLAVDLKPEGIALGAFHPGWVETDMGGSNAEIDVETSAQGLLERIDALSIATSGIFEGYDGSTMPF